MFERMAPRTLAGWLILAGVVYLLLPYDLIPDFLGLPGRIDDALVIAWLVWLYRSHVQRFTASRAEDRGAGSASGPGFGEHAERGSSSGSTRAEGRHAGASDPADPYEILGVPRTATREAIRDAYRSRMREYHPDKVAHLGTELQKLAHEKSQQIQRAYRQLQG